VNATAAAWSSSDALGFRLARARAAIVAALEQYVPLLIENPPL
jgi:hypothetical protein